MPSIVWSVLGKRVTFPLAPTRLIKYVLGDMFPFAGMVICNPVVHVQPDSFPQFVLSSIPPQLDVPEQLPPVPKHPPVLYDPEQ